jgi:thymidylate synthase
MSRIFENCREAINEIERDIMEMGIQVHPNSMQNKDVTNNEDFSTLEVQNYTFSILDMSDKDEIVEECLEWCKAEFAERISEKFYNPGEAWLLRKNVWKEFLHNGEFEYTYNKRMNCVDQIDRVIAELKINPDSRQALIHVNFPSDVLRFQKLRIPCSVYYQIMIRRNKVDIIYNMRSSDYDTHFSNDIWLADELRNYIAYHLKREVGIFHMNVGSLHRYKNYTIKHVF